MRGHDIEQVTISFGQGVYINAVFVNRNRGNVISVLQKNVSHTIVSRLLVGDSVLRGRQQTADDFHSILCTRCHDDLIRCTVDTSVPVENLAQLSAEFQVPLIGFIADGLIIFFFQQSGVNTSPPGFPWKELGKHSIMFKVVAYWEWGYGSELGFCQAGV